jgi:hypothetical protein
VAGLVDIGTRPDELRWSVGRLHMNHLLEDAQRKGAGRIQDRRPFRIPAAWRNERSSVVVDRPCAFTRSVDPHRLAIHSVIDARKNSQNLTHLIVIA